MTVKHLPGRHNQDSHGDGGGGLGDAVLATLAADKLKLGNRIPLEPGQRLAASGEGKTGPDSSLAVVMATTSSPTGPELRLGFVEPQDNQRWSGADRGGTAKLDRDGARQLDAAIDDALDAGIDWENDSRELWVEYEATDNPGPELQARMDAWDGGATIASGVITSEWQDIAYEVVGTDDGEFGYEVRLAAKPGDVGDDWHPSGEESATFDEVLLGKLQEQIAAMLDRADTQKSRTTSARTESRYMQTKSFRPTFKGLDDDAPGMVRFVVATLNEVDKDGDVTLPGFFGKQHVQMVPVHNWDHVPIGKGVITELAGEAIAEVKLNLAIPEAKSWHEAIKFDLANPPALQEYSYGFTVLDGGSESGDFKGRRVRFLKSRPDGTPGVDVHEVSPVLLGAGTTRTLGVKSAPIRFADEAQAVVAAVRALSDRAADVMAMRLAKGKGLSSDSTDLLTQVATELKRLDALLTAPDEPETDELTRIYLRQIARTHR